MKRIGIHNASMKARGGGEKKAVIQADHLSRRYEVSLLVSEPIDAPAVERYFGVDLSRVKIVVVGQSPLMRYGGTDSWQGYMQQGRALDARISDYRKIKAVPLDLFINNAISSKMICPVKNEVIGVETDSRKTAAINAGRCFIKEHEDGLEIRVYDPDVQRETLRDSNLANREQRLPDLPRILCADIAEIIAHAQALIVCQRRPEFACFLHTPQTIEILNLA